MRRSDRRPRRHQSPRRLRQVSSGAALEKMDRTAAKERQGSGTDRPQHSGKLPEGSRGDTRDKVAEAVGMSGRTYDKAKVVVGAARENPSLAPVVEEMDRTGKV